MRDYYIGQIILDNGVYKVVKAIGKDWIETSRLKPNDKGWHKIEKTYFNDRPLKISEYEKLRDLIPFLAK